MQFKRSTILGLAAAALAAGSVFAASHANVDGAIKARQAHMDLYSFNLGILGNMAKGDIEYDATAAQSAADSLAALAVMNQDRYWPMGSSTADTDKTRALPAIWEGDSDIGDKAKALVDATMAMSANASSLEGLRTAMTALGGACGECHKAYRQPE